MLVTPTIGTLTSNFALAILGILPGSSKYFFDFDIHTNPAIGASNRKVYDGSIRYEKKLLWVVKISYTITEREKTAPDGYLPFDTYSGGYYDVTNVTDNVTFSIPNNSFVNIKYGFIPVVSALDIKRNNGAVVPSDYLKKYAGGTTPESALASKFDDFIVDFNDGNAINNAHISFQVRNGNWLALHLDNIDNNEEVSNCSFMCDNVEISGVSAFCSSSFYGVPEGAISYTWTILGGNDVVSLQSDNNTIILTRNGLKSGKVTIRVVIDGGGCGTKTLTKDVWVGTLKFHDFTDVNPDRYPQLTPIEMEDCSIVGFAVNFWPLEQTVLSYQWEKVTQDLPWNRDYGLDPSNRVFLYPTCNKNFTFKVRVLNECGWSDWVELTYSINSCSQDCSPPFSGLIGENFILTPNPVTDGILNVQVRSDAPWYYSADDDTTNPLDPSDDLGDGSNRPLLLLRANITIYNQLGILVQSFSNTIMPTSLIISSLPQGSYLVVFEFLGQTESHTIIKY
jgi:hypothetical protein